MVSRFDGMSGSSTVRAQLTLALQADQLLANMESNAPGVAVEASAGCQVA